MLISLIASLPLVLGSAIQAPFAVHEVESDGDGGRKVNVTLAVMSRCPDARLCESVFEDVFATKGIPSKVSLNMAYIGTSNASEPLGVSCKHGERECLGNAHQLCLHKHLSLQDFYANIACQNYQDFPGDIGSVAYTRQCAEASGVDWDKSGVGACIERKEQSGLGKEARGLLRDNVKQTEESGVKTSCTVIIASTVVKGGERRCVVDDGVWRGCDDGHAASDFVRVIEEEYDSLRK